MNPCSCPLRVNFLLFRYQIHLVFLLAHSCACSVTAGFAFSDVCLVCEFGRKNISSLLRGVWE
ncbi:hypothetical protein RchiOBHm_Chr7g0185811 [Rosa chinensis]|uniref:Uncharacterized protein n=1 Tax=Rosa chinensis TaxID=74649 RepID=A0A2P6P3U2_ROSCH|nr:hypothetical protein RchiOBHm_Chr7g0185811 [Rosa chinensis]